MDIGRLDEAAADVRERLALEPADVSLVLLYARILAKMGSAAAAESALDKARGLDPANPDLLYVRAYLYAAAGDRARTLPILEKARRADPVWFSYFLAENYAALGMPDEALAVIEEGIRNGFSKAYDFLYPYQVLASGAYQKLRSDSRFQTLLESQRRSSEAQREKYRDLCSRPRRP